MLTKTKTTTVVTKTIVCKNAAELRDAPPFPSHARIYMSIPSGGDWSNRDLTVDGETPLIIEWDEVTVTEN